MDIFKAMYESGAVPVITVNNPDKAVGAARAMLRGGTKVVEIALRIPGAAACIKAVREQVPDIAVGAGTVLSKDQVDEAIEAGAMFAVAPGYDEEVVSYSLKRGLPFIPGTIHATDIQKGVKAGLKVIKFFPSEPLGGLTYIDYLAAPFNMVKFLPAGGVGFDNLEAYLDNPAVHCCAGGFMCRSSHIENEEWDTITELCSRMTAIAGKRLNK